MKKITVKYDRRVPQEIIDLMGDQPYKFIWGYTGALWRDARISAAPELKTTIVYKSDTDSIIDGSFEKVIERLQSYINDPDYISGRFETEYDYDYGYETSLVVETKCTPTEKELDLYNKNIEIYNSELVVWNKLENIIESIMKAEKNITKQQKIAKLKKELQKLEKES